MSQKRSLTLIHSAEHAGWVFDSSHPTQGRRYINAQQSLLAMAKMKGVEVIEVLPRSAKREELEIVHTPSYMAEVLDQGICNEWEGENKKLSQLAALFAGGSLTALELLLAGKSKSAIHFAGAKHHAQAEHSYGFCVFNDFAIAAQIASRQHGLKVAILDIDGHHGDGVENLTADNKDVLSFSIHHYGIFPGTGGADQEELNVFNQPLNAGDSDDKLFKGVDRFITLAKKFKADIIFIACGADGHVEDPLTGLAYSVEGLAKGCEMVRKAFTDLPILFGGAGGYLPDSRTPEVWATAALCLVE